MWHVPFRVRNLARNVASVRWSDPQTTFAAKIVCGKNYMGSIPRYVVTGQSKAGEKGIVSPRRDVRHPQLARTEHRRSAALQHAIVQFLAIRRKGGRVRISL